MNLTIEDYNWISKKIREEFDTPAEVYDFEHDLRIIDRAERFGLSELASQMRDDIVIHARQKTA